MFLRGVSIQLERNMALLTLVQLAYIPFDEPLALMTTVSPSHSIVSTACPEQVCFLNLNLSHWAISWQGVCHNHDNSLTRAIPDAHEAKASTCGSSGKFSRKDNAL